MILVKSEKLKKLTPKSILSKAGKKKKRKAVLIFKKKASQKIVLSMTLFFYPKLVLYTLLVKVIYDKYNYSGLKSNDYIT